MSWEVNRLLDKLPPYQGDRRTLVRGRQSTYQIVDEILDGHRRYGPYYDRIALNFWKGTPRATADYLYTFAKQHLPYKAESGAVQTIKKPQAILAERYDFGSDCKHYASMIIGIGEALRRMGYPIKCFYRFGIYNPKHKSPGHVFAVFMINGREVWIDPIPQMHGLDARNMPPIKFIDKIPPMTQTKARGIGSIYEISGIEPNQGALGVVPYDQNLGGIAYNQNIGSCSWYDQHYGKGRRFHPRREGLHRYQVAGDEMGKLKIRIKLPKIKPDMLLKKFGGAPSRNAFLLLVKLNTFHLATKMWKKAAHDKNSPQWKKLASAWERLGGKSSKLYREITRGVNTYNKLHKAKKRVSGTDDPLYMSGDDLSGMYVDPTGELLQGTDESIGEVQDQIGEYIEGMSVGAVLIFVRQNHEGRMRRIGVVQAVAAAGIIAAAAPIIAALGNILKSFGVNTKNAKQASDADTKDLAREYADAAQKGDANPDGSVTTADGKQIKVQDNPDGSQTMSVKNQPGLSDQETTEADDDNAETTTKTKSVTKTKTKTSSSDDDEGGSGGFMANINDFVNSHKTGVAITGAGIALTIVGATIKGKGPMKPILMMAGVGAMGVGAFNLFKK